MNAARINNRFRELMARDPLVIKYHDEFHQYMEDNPALKEGSHIFDSPEALGQLGAEVMQKWNSPLLEGLGSVEYFAVQKTLPPISKLAAWKQEVRFPDSPEHPKEVSAFFENPGHLYIDINCDLLDKNDARYVKRAVWELVKSHLESRKTSTEGQDPRKREPASPPHDPPELAPFYHMKEDVFRNYLRWYDIHTKEKLSFRLMAVVEGIRKDNVSGAEGLLNRFIHKRVKLGNPVKGEDRIEKGVKIIWAAIYREPYNQKGVSPQIEEYNCTLHGNDCPRQCKYLKEWEGRFNRLNPI